MEGSIAGSEAEQNLQTLHEAVAAAQAAEAAAAAVQGVFHDHPAFQGQMRQLMAHQEPALQADESLLELAETSDTKRCAACRIVKPVSEYYKDRTHSRGIKTRCKDCLRACKEAFKNQQRAKSAAEQVTVTTKKCSHCGEEKAAADFSRSSYQRTGLRSWCKECSSKSKKQAKAEGRWKSYDSKAKLHQQRIEELIAMQQPRKCRKCEEVRQPEEFPPDPRQPSSKLKECHYCIEAQSGGYASVGLNPDGTVPLSVLMQEHWQADQSRNVQYTSGLAADHSAYHHHAQPSNDNLMRILQAAVTGNIPPDDARRMASDLRGQQGMYPQEIPEHFQDLAPETRAAVLQQIVDQQQRQSLLQAQAHQDLNKMRADAGYGNEAVYQPEPANMGYPATYRPADGHMLQYQEQHEQQAEQGNGSPEEHPREERHAGMSMAHYDQLRNLPYSTNLPHLQHHLQQHQITGLPHHDWTSAFASVPRAACDGIQPEGRALPSVAVRAGTTPAKQATMAPVPSGCVKNDTVFDTFWGWEPNPGSPFIDNSSERD